MECTVKYGTMLAMNVKPMGKDASIIPWDMGNHFDSGLDPPWQYCWHVKIKSMQDIRSYQPSLSIVDVVIDAFLDSPNNFVLPNQLIKLVNQKLYSCSYMYFFTIFWIIGSYMHA